MATPIRRRVERLEHSTRFREWLRFQRYLECLTDQQIEAFAVLGYFPEPAPTELKKGTSRLDSLPRKELIQMFEADERERAKFAHRNDQDKEFYITHGHWPEKSCQGSDCRKPWSDELRKQYAATEAKIETDGRI